MLKVKNFKVSIQRKYFFELRQTILKLGLEANKKLFVIRLALSAKDDAGAALACGSTDGGGDGEGERGERGMSSGGVKGAASVALQRPNRPNQAEVSFKMLFQLFVQP